MAGWILPTLTTTYIQITAIYLAVFFAYYPTTQVLFERWLKFDEALSHGLLVVAMSIYLAVKALSYTSAKPEPQKPSYSFFAGLLVSSFVWLIISAANINIIEQMLMPLILWFALGAAFGSHTAKYLALPAAYLYFAIPLWDYFNNALVDLSSVTVTWAVEKAGITALINGNTITLPYGSLVIADGCSGLRYFTIALALACFVILDSKRNLKLSLQLLTTAIVLSLLSNWIRIFLITLIAYETNMETGLVEDHETFGWFVFGIVLAPIFFLAKRFDLEDKLAKENISRTKTSNWVMMLIVLAAAPLIGFGLSGSIKEPSLDKLVLAHYQDLTTKPALPNLPNAHRVLHRQTGGYQQTVDLYRVLHWRKSSEDNLVPYWPNTFSHTSWESQRLAHINIDAKEFEFMQLRNKLNGKQTCIAYHYDVGNQRTTAYKEAKLLQIPAILLGQNTFEGQVAVAGLGGGSCEALRTKMTDALTEMSTPIFTEKTEH
jgi:exosortase